MLYLSSARPVVFRNKPDTTYVRVVWCTEQLDKKVRELYDVMCRLEEEKYDWEMKLIRQNAEVTCLEP